MKNNKNNTSHLRSKNMLTSKYSTDKQNNKLLEDLTVAVFFLELRRLEANRQQTDKQTDRQTNRQTDRHTWVITIPCSS